MEGADGSAEEGGVVTTCELTTYEPDEDDDSNEIGFDSNSLVSKIIMKVFRPSLEPSTTSLTPFYPPFSPIRPPFQNILTLRYRVNGSTRPSMN